MEWFRPLRLSSGVNALLLINQTDTKKYEVELHWYDDETMYSQHIATKRNLSDAYTEMAKVQGADALEIIEDFMLPF